MPDYEELNKRTRRLLEKVDMYIFMKFQSTDQIVSQRECLKTIEDMHFDPIERKIIPIDRSKFKAEQAASEKPFIVLYDEFIEYKRVELKDSPSMKDYKSLLNALLDFQTHTGKKFTLETVNDKDFFNRFRNYLGAKHTKGSKTKGQLNNNTVHKRFSSLKTFMRWVEEKEIFVFKHTLYDYKIQKFNTNFVALTRDDIKQIENIKTDNPFWQKILDVFICNCFMSLRFGDLISMEKGKFLKDEAGDYYYKKNNEKTGIPIEIPITPTAFRILEKYDFELPVYTNQYFNSELFNILEHHKLFGEKIQKQELKNGKPVVKFYKKRELITSHTARRTFITLAITNNVPLNAIQSSTGHTQLSTLSKYVKANRNKAQINKID
jgi:integrase